MNGYTLTMGIVLKKWREERGLSLSYIAEKQNMKELLLERLERGEEVESYVLLNYLDEICRIDSNFDVIREWRKELGFGR